MGESLDGSLPADLCARLLQLLDSADCLRRKVGSVVLTWDGQILTEGYNSTFREPSCTMGGCARCADPRIQTGERHDLCECKHAEYVALSQIKSLPGRPLGVTLVSTTPPCHACRALAELNGVTRVLVATCGTSRLDSLTLKEKA